MKSYNLCPLTMMYWFLAQKPITKTNNQEMTVIFLNIQKLNSTLLNNTWVKEDISREIRKYFEMNKNEYQNAGCRSEVNNLSFHLMKLEKKDQNKFETGRTIEIIKNRS